MILHDLGTALVTVHVAKVRELGTNDVEQLVRIGKNSRKFFNFFQNISVFLEYLILLKARQSVQPKIENRLRLDG